MRDEFFKTLDKLIEATDQAYIREDKNNDTSVGDLRYFTLSLNVSPKFVGRVKSYAIDNGLALGKFIQHTVEKELKRIEKESGEAIIPVDTRTRMSSGRTPSPEQRTNTLIKNFHKKLKQIKDKELLS